MMKTQTQRSFLVLALLGLSAAQLATAVSGQSFQPIYYGFSGSSLILGPDGSFYGTSAGGGAYGQGTVFRVTTNGTLTNLYSFSAALYATNVDGGDPDAAVTLGPDGNFYGTTVGGGTGANGSVFRVTTNGTLTTLHSFSALDLTNADGANPYSALTLGPDGNFYGTALGGGVNGSGTIFRITTNGTFTVLYSFSASPKNNVNADGAYPHSALTLGPDGNFYGTAMFGGAYGNGTVFRITTNGVMTTLNSFSYNSNGCYPQAALTWGGDGFYGTTTEGGFGNGNVFRVTTNGALTPLYSFSRTYTTNADGADPVAALTLGPDGNFYGTTQGGGENGEGGIFCVTRSGALTNIYSFSVTDQAYGTNADGAKPSAGLTLGPDGNFYGTTGGGGANGDGVIYRLSVVFSPLIEGIVRNADGSVTLEFSSSPSGSTRLWAATNPAASTVWQPIFTNTSIPMSGIWQFTDTNTVNVPNRFYRLSTP